MPDGSLLAGWKPALHTRSVVSERQVVALVERLDDALVLRRLVLGGLDDDGHALGAFADQRALADEALAVERVHVLGLDELLPGLLAAERVQAAVVDLLGVEGRQAAAFLVRARLRGRRRRRGGGARVAAAGDGESGGNGEAKDGGTDHRDLLCARHAGAQHEPLTSGA